MFLIVRPVPALGLLGRTPQHYVVCTSWSWSSVSSSFSPHSDTPEVEIVASHLHLISHIFSQNLQCLTWSHKNEILQNILRLSYCLRAHTIYQPWPPKVGISLLFLASWWSPGSENSYDHSSFISAPGRERLTAYISVINVEAHLINLKALNIPGSLKKFPTHNYQCTESLVNLESKKYK